MSKYKLGGAGGLFLWVDCKIGGNIIRSEIARFVMGMCFEQVVDKAIYWGARSASVRMAF